MLAEHADGQHRRRRRARDAGARLVDHEDPIGISVERQADVEATSDDAGPDVALVGRLQRVGRVVGERAVELAVHHLQFDGGQAIEHRRHDESAHSVRCVGDHAQRAQLLDVDERHDVVDERRQQVLFGPPAAGGCGSRAPACEHGLGDDLDLPEAAVDADRTGAGQAQLDAVVLGRVVRGREHRARAVERPSGEVQEIGRAQAEVDDVDTLLQHAVGERGDEVNARRPHVASHEHPIGRGEAGEGRPRRHGRRPSRVDRGRRHVGRRP